ncbi:hypothetical protein ACFL2Q_00775 [Thermodesulfobacteriota bacterium]
MAHVLNDKELLMVFSLRQGPKSRHDLCKDLRCSPRTLRRVSRGLKEQSLISSHRDSYRVVYPWPDPEAVNDTESHCGVLVSSDVSVDLPEAPTGETSKPETREEPSPAALGVEYQWFIETFQEACREQRTDLPDLTLSQGLSTDMEKWLADKLSKGRYLGNKYAHYESIYGLKEKLHEIIAGWESIDVVILGERVEMPPSPDLVHLVTYRESLFSWADRQRSKQIESIMDRLETRRLMAT